MEGLGSPWCAPLLTQASAAFVFHGCWVLEDECPLREGATRLQLRAALIRACREPRGCEDKQSHCFLIVPGWLSGIPGWRVVLGWGKRPQCKAGVWHWENPSSFGKSPIRAWEHKGMEWCRCGLCHNGLNTLVLTRWRSLSLPGWWQLSYFPREEEAFLEPSSQPLNRVMLKGNGN